MLTASPIADLDLPPAGTACRACRNLGHFCPARVYADGGEALCAACAIGAECERAAAIRKLHEPWTGEELDAVAPPPVRSIDPSTWSPQPAAEPGTCLAYASDGRFAVSEAAKLHRAVLDRRKAKHLRQQKKWRENHPAPHKEKPPMPSPTPQTPAAGSSSAPPSVRDRCRIPGCTFAAAKGSSYCSSKHFYLVQKERRGDPIPDRYFSGTTPAPPANRPPTQKIQPPAESKKPEPPPGATETAGEEAALTVTFTLTEQQCDSLYRRCSPAQKATAMSSLLRQLLAI